MPNQTQPEYIKILEKYRGLQLNLASAYENFVDTLRAEVLRDPSNLEIARAAGEAAEGLLSYKAGNEEDGSKKIKDADERVLGFSAYLAGVKFMGPQRLAKLRPAELIRIPQQEGLQRLALYRRQRTLDQQLATLGEERSRLEQRLAE